MGGLRVVAQEVNVAADRDGLARRPVEVGGHPRHQELGMKAHEDEDASPPRDASHLAVQRRQLGQMLVGQRLRAEIIRLVGQAGVRDVGHTQRPIDTLPPGDLEHLGRDVDAIDGGRGPPAHPRADAAGAAREIEHAAWRRPVDRLQPVQPAHVHLVLHRLLVRADPCSVSFAYVDDRVPAPVVEGVVHEPVPSIPASSVYRARPVLLRSGHASWRSQPSGTDRPGSPYVSGHRPAGK